MSRFSELKARGPWRPVATLLALVALGFAAATLASDRSREALVIRTTAADSHDEVGPGNSPSRADEPSGLGKAAKSPRSLFRCWQDGRMIYEGRGYGALPKSQVAAELKSGDSAAGTVQVLDLYQSLCVLELPK